MSEERWRIGDAASAAAALAYFNGFHDGFVRELVLRSHDRFAARGVQELSGRLDLELVLAHCNYRDGEPPADQLVRARFRGVADLAADLPNRPGEWSIDRVEIAPVDGPAGGARLAAGVFHHVLVDRAWGTREVLRFTFSEADLDERFV